MARRTAFAGGSPAYLRDVQYRDGSNLSVRIALHREFSTARVDFADFQAALIRWPARAQVLDCGAGTGRFWSNQVVPRSLSLTLTDTSPGMVDAASKAATSSGFSDVQGRECDVQALPFEDGTFDVVLANHMLYHVSDPDRAVAELGRVVRPDGTVLASTNGHGHMREMTDAIAEVFGERKEVLYDVFGIDSGEARLRKTFQDVSWHAYDNALVVGDLDAAVAYGLSFPPGDSASPEQRRALRDALHRQFEGDTLTIHTRGGSFVCRRPRE